MTARPIPPRRVELLVLLAGFLVLVAAVAAFDWRLAGVLTGIGLILSAVDVAGLIGGRRR